MDTCACGAQRRKFWLWQDTNGGIHASSFEPSAGMLRAVLAVNARDALMPVARGATPKHAVTDAGDPTLSWAGRCSASS